MSGNQTPACGHQLLVRDRSWKETLVDRVGSRDDLGDSLLYDIPDPPTIKVENDPDATPVPPHIFAAITGLKNPQGTAVDSSSAGGGVARGSVR